MLPPREELIKEVEAVKEELKKRGKDKGAFSRIARKYGVSANAVRYQIANEQERFIEGKHKTVDSEWSKEWDKVREELLKKKQIIKTIYIVGK